MKYFSFIPLLILFALCSCSRDKDSGHPDFFDKPLDEATRIRKINPAQALVYVDSLYSTFPHPGIKDLYRKYSLKLDCYIALGDQSDMASVYVDSMLWIIRNRVQDNDYAEDYGHALLKKANILVWKKDYQNALEYDYQARLAVEKTKDSCLLSAYTYMLGDISFRQKKYKDAIKYLKQGLAESAHCSDEYQKFQQTQAKLDDLGLAYSKCAMPDSAMHYYNAAMDYIDKNGVKYAGRPRAKEYMETAIGVVYGNIGSIYYDKGDTARAEQLFKQSISINNRRGYTHSDAQLIMQKLVRLYLAGSRLVKAAEALADMQASIDSFPNRQVQMNWYELQLQYLERTGNTKDAYSYARPYLALKDSFANLKPLQQLDLDAENKRIKDQYAIALLAKQNELKNIYLLIFLVVSVLTIIIAYALWRSGRRSRQLNDRISRQNAQMQQVVTSLTQSQEENTRMMQIVAHDLKNPIASMVSISMLLLADEARSADDNELLLLLKESGQYSLGMISDILNSTMTSGDMSKELVDTHQLLRYCVDLLQFKASEKKQQITLDAEEVMLVINKEKIWRVVSNLIVNAIKFSPSGTAINITGKRALHEFVIKVQDHGIGIPHNMKDHIFDKSADVKRLGTCGEKSYGLGLAISKEIIEAHGGRIWFESAPEGGSSFFIALPA